MKYDVGLEGLKRLGRIARLPVHIAIGVFDGVHIGHQKILSFLSHRRAYCGGTSAVLTFLNHPLEVVKGITVKFISPLEYRFRRFDEFGIEWVIGINFTQEFSRLTPREFLSVLKGAFRGWKGNCGLTFYEGDNFRFGYRNAGDVKWLSDKKRIFGYKLEVVERVRIDGKVVSSSLVRESVSKGDVDFARKLLGRNFFIEGKVVEDRGIGRQIGFPTANLKVDSRFLIPSIGVYAGWGFVGDVRYPAMVYVGTRPTFGGGQSVVEVHLIGYNGGKINELRIEFVSFIRGEEKFSDLASLRNALVNDKKRILKVLEGGYVA